jgi:hypothetical protein
MTFRDKAYTMFHGKVIDFLRSLLENAGNLILTAQGRGVKNSTITLPSEERQSEAK